MLPPLWNPPYRDDDLRHIAGFVSHVRQRVLSALASLEQLDSPEVIQWRDATVAYWESGERWTRWMLWELGYPVRKGQQWDQSGGDVSDGP